MSPHRRCVIIGAGRAGGALALALRSVGWHVDIVRARPLTDAAEEHLRSAEAVQQVNGLAADADLVLLTVPDSAIAAIAGVIEPIEGVVAHVSGATTLEPLSLHGRVGSIHPLMALPGADEGARRLLARGTFAIDGDAVMADVVASLGGRSVHVPADKRVAYHAAASIAANHLVVLCDQIERLAADAGVPADAYWAMMSAGLDDVARAGAPDALTGPASRGDWVTIRRHLAALPSNADRELYAACSNAAARLAGREPPADLTAR